MSTPAKAIKKHYTMGDTTHGPAAQASAARLLRNLQSSYPLVAAVDIRAQGSLIAYVQALAVGSSPSYEGEDNHCIANALKVVKMLATLDEYAGMECGLQRMPSKPTGTDQHSFVRSQYILTMSEGYYYDYNAIGDKLLLLALSTEQLAQLQTLIHDSAPITRLTPLQLRDIKRITGHSPTTQIQQILIQFASLAGTHPGLSWSEDHKRHSTNTFYDEVTERLETVMVSPAATLNLVCTALLDRERYPHSSIGNELDEKYRLESLANALLKLQQVQVCSAGRQHELLFY